MSVEVSPVYYRIYFTPRPSYTQRPFIVVCMQDFDEYDYDQGRFLNQNQYPEELDAQADIDRLMLFLTTNGKLQLIDTLSPSSLWRYLIQETEEGSLETEVCHYCGK